jgi:hypothetical protein
MKVARTLALCLIALTPIAYACDEEAMRALLSACVDEAKAPTSNDQKKGREWIIEGRFCNNTDRVVDGFLLCQGHDMKAIGAAMACKPPAQLKIAVEAIADADPRKPANCR